MLYPSVIDRLWMSLCINVQVYLTYPILGKADRSCKNGENCIYPPNGHSINRSLGMSEISQIQSTNV